jgi:hypothetical protein
MLKSELMAAPSLPGVKPQPLPIGNDMTAALTTALENALNFPLTLTLRFYEKCRDCEFHVAAKSAIVRCRVDIDAANNDHSWESIRCGLR